ncbi:pyoverdine/dityrosine biosynthesis protein [Aspergillus piperis CBS 112811]|uniref:Pyoverdine/dityrosine biosynthesis protein n=1 Tax=Aspergillus piperis CBS 112811 TaxID=1448313 RepID=A0A8G1R3Q7_9EURO|nr:pyoverdine/dityrosine biosynthesis protein [Aspergillus piperis CBS 112811]RAH58713.1 pyoverdine/dityrosine biosynthesis protein [Aspergillus piperis CBS 112811]
MDGTPKLGSGIVSLGTDMFLMKSDTIHTESEVLPVDADAIPMESDSSHMVSDGFPMESDVNSVESNTPPLESDHSHMESDTLHMEADPLNTESGVFHMELDKSIIDPQIPECKYDDDPLLKAFKVMEVIGRYRSVVPATARDHTSDGNIMFLSKMCNQIRAKQPIQMILPAFPFKSPNRENKVLGSLPDKGEDISLAHLNGLCAAIGDVYEYGAKLTIVSDGLVYNDILGVSDRDVWEYSHALREMVVENKYDHIVFARLRNLVHIHEDVNLDGETYEKLAPEFRQELIKKYTPEGFDAAVKIKTDENFCTTYRGYIKFLTKDLEHLHVDDGTKSRKSHKKHLGDVAKSMIERGAAFAEAILKNFPGYIRLSIHPSNGLTKISINVLPRTPTPVTPWHSALCYTADGGFMYGWREIFDADPEMELVHKNGRPWCYRFKSELYNWPLPVTVDHIYPCGMMVTPVNPTSISEIDKEKVQALANENSPIILRGFTDTHDHELIVKKAESMNASHLSASDFDIEEEAEDSDPEELEELIRVGWVPFDGASEITKDKDADNTKQSPSKYQMITATLPISEKTRRSLFSASSLFFSHLPASYTVEMLQQFSWKTSSSSSSTNTKTKTNSLPLITPHFSHGRPCFHYHPLLSQSNITSEPTYAMEGISDADSNRLCNVLNPLLYDRRVCYWHTWEQGDVVIDDTFTTTLTWEPAEEEPVLFLLHSGFPC